SRVSIGFSCTISEIQNTGHSRRISPWEVVQTRFREKMRRSYKLHEVAPRVEFRFVLRAPSRKFKILAIHNVLAHAIHNVLAHISHVSMVSQKNATVINFKESRVSIGFSCTVSKIQNTGLSRLISPWEVVQARFAKN
ncbi:hypothetical protein BHM03_00055223, partial [Ensete ventricosum]